MKPQEMSDEEIKNVFLERLNKLNASVGGDVLTYCYALSEYREIRDICRTKNLVYQNWA